MRLTTVKIRNFRCLRDVTVDLDETTVLIGENNSGKTAFLEAIRICLERLRGRGRSPFDDYDYHLPDDEAAPTDTAPVEIELSFVETGAEPWNEEVVQALADLLARDADDQRRVTFRVTSSFDQGTGEFVTDWDFLDANGNPLPAGKAPRQLNTLQRLAPTFYLSALGNAERMLCDAGFGDLYEARMSRQKAQPTSPRGTPDYWTQVLNALPRATASRKRRPKPPLG